MTRVAFALAFGFAVGLVAGCANFEADFQQYCQSRTTCSVNQPCCEGFACQNGRCMALSLPDGGRLPDGGMNPVVQCVPACGGPTPYCGPDGLCKTCQGTQGCPAPLVCNQSFGVGECVECVDNSQCATKTFKTCHPFKHQCVQCQDNTPCIGGTTCNVVEGICQFGGADAGYAPPARIELGNLPATPMQAGQCSNQVMIRGYDSADNQVPLSGTFTFSGTGRARFFTNGMCSPPSVSSISTTGAPQLPFFFGMEQAGPQSVTAEYSAAVQATGIIEIKAGAASKLRMSPSMLAEPGTCSHEIFVRSYDNFGNAVSFGGSINLSSSSGSAMFYLDSACSSSGMLATGTLFMGSTSNEVSYYFKESAAGSPTHNANGGGLTPGTVMHTIGPVGAPTDLSFTTAPSSLVGTCSPPFTVSLRTAGNQPAAFPAVAAVTSTSTSTDLTLYEDEACTDLFDTFPAGATSMTFYLFTKRAASPPMAPHNITVTIDSISSSFTATVFPGNPRLVFLNIPPSVPQSACQNASVALKDEYGNDVFTMFARQIQVASSPAGYLHAREQPNCPASPSMNPLTLNMPVSSSQVGFSFNFQAMPSGPVNLTATTSDGTPAANMQVAVCKGPGQVCASSIECCTAVCTGTCT